MWRVGAATREGDDRGDAAWFELGGEPWRLSDGANQDVENRWHEAVIAGRL